MRITQIMLAKGFGGAERHFVDLARELAVRGDEVQAICHPHGEARAQLAITAGLTVTTVPVYGAWDRLASWRIQRALAAFKPAAIHVHLARAAGLAAPAAARLGIPVVANTHNFIKLAYYRSVDHFITPTLRLANYLVDEGVARARITHIPHFTAQRTAAPGIAGQPIKFVSVGRLVEKKGYAVLLKALAEVTRHGIDATLLLAGDGPERHALEQQAEQLGLGSRVFFAGWVEDPHQAFSGQDIFVLPSLFEPFGIVVLEAMAAHMPIITSRSDGPLEILKQDSAWFTELGDVSSLAEAMIAAAINGRERKNKADKAAERFRLHYCDDIMIPRYRQLYAGLAGTTLPADTG